MSRAIHKLRGGAALPVSLLVETTGLSWSGGGSTTHDFTAQPVGSAAGRSIICMITCEEKSVGGGVINAVTVDPAGGNVSLSKIVEASNGTSGNTENAAVFVGGLPGGVTGNVTIRLGASINITSWGLSYIVVTDLKSATETDKASGTASGNVATSTTLSGEAGGVAAGACCGAAGNSVMAWAASMPEKSDIKVSGVGSAHRHGAAYELLPAGRTAATETVTISGGDNALACAAFR